MENLDQTKLNKPEGVDFKFTLTEEEREQLLRDIAEMKEELKEFLDNRVEKPHMGFEILEVDAEILDKKELCFFKLYKALKESGRATVDDWKKILLAITDHREQIRAKQLTCQEQKTFCDSKEMSMQDEFLAWLYNLAYAEYGKMEGERIIKARDVA